MTDKSLAGKVAIVTGASRPHGMGYAAARSLASRGATVVITDLPTAKEEYDVGAGLGSSETLKEAVAGLRSEGLQVDGVPLDLTDPDSIRACIANTVELFGGVDILVNNAGVFVGSKAFEELSPRDWEISFQVHVMGPQLLIRAVLPSMRKRGGGSIINNASNWGMGGFPNATAYVATKTALVGLTKALALDLGSDNIRVNAIAPGGINTDISQTEFEYIASLEGVTAEDVAKSQSEGCGLKRRGDPSEVGEAVAFLASPQSSFVNGAILPVDGGEPHGV